MFTVSKAPACGETGADDTGHPERTSEDMHRTSTIGTTFVAALALAGAASADLVVDLGTIRQIAPRPSLEYTGGFASHLTSFTDASGVRTVARFDLHGIVEALGGNLALVEVRVRDAGGNSYGNWSQGADIDLFRVTGYAGDGSVTAGYAGTVDQHRGESSDVLKARTAECDAVSGDQHYNSQKFISLGQGGSAWLRFADFLHSSGSASGGSSGGDGWGGGSGGDGPGSWTGGNGGESTPPVYGGLLVGAGTFLEVGEAGLGEIYGLELVFEESAVPAPGAFALLLTAGLVARRRR